MKFLEESQAFFKAFGYCFYDRDVRLPEDRRATFANVVCSILYIWVYVVSFDYVSNSQHPRKDRLFVLLTFVVFFEIAGAHFTLTRLKPEIYDFFYRFQTVLNERMA